MHLVLSKISPDDPVYRRAVRREGKFWKGQSDDPANPSHIPQPFIAYRNSQETGNASTDRFMYLQRLGPFKRGLSIGCGSANVERVLMERGIVQEFTFVDISEESLAALVGSLDPKTRTRVQVLRQDLNFIKLEEKYDFIFCANVLHHLINLEHVFLELNNALTDSGIIVIDDFIGESRFQFSDRRIKELNRVGMEAQRRTGIAHHPMVRTSRRTLINACPFEAIRSEDILPLLRQLYRKHTVREACYGALSAWANVVVNLSPSVPEGMRNAAAKLFIEEDRRITRSKSLPPMRLFGIYRKNPNPPKWKVRPWTKKELRHHLPVSVFDEGIVMRGAGLLSRLIGDGKAYQALRRAYLRLRS